MHSLPIRIGDYVIKNPAPSGGKAGKGHNVTSTIQVKHKDMFVVKHFRYKMFAIESKHLAIEKAISWVNKQLNLVK